MLASQRSTYTWRGRGVYHREQGSDTDPSFETDSAARPYRIGVLGVGHWAKKFEDAFENQPLTYQKATDLKDYQQKKMDVLDDLGVSEDNYVQVDNGQTTIPDGFLDDLDVIQIATPIDLHKEQALNAIHMIADQGLDTVVVTEKAYGPTIDTFDTVKTAAADHDVLTYEHLHYLRKQPTRWLHRNFDDLVKDYGQIQSVDATFIEEEREEDRRRTHIYPIENSGGIVMDWIHPLEVLVGACNVQFDDVEADGFITNTDYSADDPTAVRAAYAISGDHIAPGATVNQLVGKGFPSGYTYKAMQLSFEDADVNLSYVDSKTERETPHRGQISIHTCQDGDAQETYAERLQGDTPYELMAQDMMGAVETRETPDMLENVAHMYETVDATNDALDEARIISRAEAQQLAETSIQNTAPLTR